MSPTSKRTGFDPLKYDIFAGMDVDKPGFSVSIFDHHGFIESFRMPYRSQHLIQHIRTHYAGKNVAFAYESGPTGYGLYDDLTKNNYYCMVVCAAKVPSIAGNMVKTNRRDSIKIAQALRGGQLNGIHVPDITYRNLRHLVQLRDHYSKQIAANKSRIKMLLLFEGIDFPTPEYTSAWSRAIIQLLHDIPCRETVRFKLDALLSNLAYNKEQLLLTMKHMRAYCKQNEEINHNVILLTSIPGIGKVVAMDILARIGDWRLLTNVRQLAGFLGLVPRERSTGGTVRRGPITRAGHSRTRNKLIQSAWVAIRKEPVLNEFYQRMYRTHCRDFAAKKAVVAVARKLTTRIYAVLHQQKPYEIRPTTASSYSTPIQTTYAPRGTSRLVIEPAPIGC